MIEAAAAAVRLISPEHGAKCPPPPDLSAPLAGRAI